jgi:large subunit ribosomal protein L29
MTVEELKGKSRDELKAELEALLREQFSLRMQKGSGQLAKPHKIKEVRRNIARVRTVMNERARMGG